MGSELLLVDPYKKENQKEKEFKEAVMSSMGWKFTESVTMNGNDCVINLENFEQGLFNFILVIGLPGSGKGTFGRELSKKYNCGPSKITYYCGRVLEFIKKNKKIRDIFSEINDLMHECLKEYDDNNNNEPHYIKIKENTEVEE